MMPGTNLQNAKPNPDQITLRHEEVDYYDAPNVRNH